MDLLAQAALFAAYELGLFAAIVFLLFGMEDLGFDALWLAGVGHGRDATAPSGPPVRRMAVMIAAWDEGEVIGQMLATLAQRWSGAPIRVYVGVYANDLATMTAAGRVAAADPRIRLVINAEDGPTTKGGCLNTIWRALRRDALLGHFAADAVLIHDAEDLVDPAEIEILSAALGEVDYAQLPVIPLIEGASRWIGRHYCDEFAEAHGKELPVRSALQVPLPTAGVGCAFRVDALTRIATARGPFAEDSLTEDYELGMRLAASGARGRFVKVRRDGRIVASRAWFPHRLDHSVAQKTRWLRGIAFDGWDRLGWITRPGAPLSARLIGWWMLWRDRRAGLAAVAILAGYCAILLGLGGMAGGAAIESSPAFYFLLLFNAVLLLWRLGMRAGHVGAIYGWRHAPMAAARQIVSNIILVMTARRALLHYWPGRRGATLVWDKTQHRFPAMARSNAR